MKHNASNDGMSKFAVTEESGDRIDKVAAQGCPDCGEKPQRYGDTLLCPNHGSEPFERGTE